jgi:hypothetical protein
LFFSSSGSTDNTADTLEDTWESGETGTKERTKEELLFLSSGRSNDTADSVKDTWESGESGTKKGTEEHFLLTSRKFLLSTLGSSDDVSNTIHHAWGILDDRRTVFLGTSCSTSGESTEHGSPTEVLLLSSGSGTGDSSDDGRKETSHEAENHFLFLRVHLLHGFLETVESESSTESTDVSTS